MRTFRACLIILFWSGALLFSSFPEASASPTEVRVKQVNRFVYCTLKHKGPLSEIEDVINNLISTMRSQNIFPQGPMLGIYHTIPGPDTPENAQMEWEIGFPITDQAFVQAPLEKKVWIHTTVAFAIHTGPYEETGETITDIFQWMEENGYDRAGPVVEIYGELGTPEQTQQKSPSEIWIPCKKK
ncbi:MAG: GyrI-like domain-containing protein [Candidatus Aminicenantales bacterium]